MVIITQWAFKPQIDVNIWLISWDISRPDFLLKSNCMYYMDINTGCPNVKNVSRKWSLPINVGENKCWLIKHFG